MTCNSLVNHPKEFAKALGTSFVDSPFINIKAMEEFIKNPENESFGESYYDRAKIFFLINTNRLDPEIFGQEVAEDYNFVHTMNRTFLTTPYLHGSPAVAYLPSESKENLSDERLVSLIHKDYYQNNIASFLTSYTRMVLESGEELNDILKNITSEFHFDRKGSYFKFNLSNEQKESLKSLSFHMMDLMKDLHEIREHYEKRDIKIPDLDEPYESLASLQFLVSEISDRYPVQESSYNQRSKDKYLYSLNPPKENFFAKYREWNKEKMSRLFPKLCKEFESREEALYTKFIPLGEKIDRQNEIAESINTEMKRLFTIK